MTNYTLDDNGYPIPRARTHKEIAAWLASIESQTARVNALFEDARARAKARAKAKGETAA